MLQALSHKQDEEAELEAVEAALAGLSVQRSPLPRPPRHLLILDVNGLLVDRLQQAAQTPADLTYGGRYHVYDRPHVRDFVAWLLQRFRVAVWSSAQVHNVEPMVAHIFGASASALRFVWGQDRCSIDGKVKLAGGRSKPRFLKELRLVYAAGHGTESSTCLVDDDEYKAVRNPPHTALHPRAYTVSEKDTDTELAERGTLRSLLAMMAEAPSIPAFVRAHGKKLER